MQPPWQPDCPATLVALAHRCLEQPPSRALDAEIYCALHGIVDANDLSTPALVAARHAGEVLIAEPGRPYDCPEWIEAPPFTGALEYATLLLPDGVHALSKHPARVCATALSVLAMTAAPPAAPRWPDNALADVTTDRSLEFLSTP